MAFDREQLLEKLAKALLNNPGISMSELAQEAGISKASLHRIYSTKENLQKIIVDKLSAIFGDIHKITLKNSDDFLADLEELVRFHCENSTYVLFLGRDDFFEMFGDEKFDSYYDELENFFRAGQKKGCITLDLDAGIAADIFISLMTGLLEAYQWGHIPYRNLDKVMLRAFLGGIENRTS